MKPHRRKIPPRVNKMLRDRQLALMPGHAAGAELRRRGVSEDDISLFFIARAREGLRV